MIRVPGLELLGITPNWLLIWLITWSVKRNIWQSLIAATALGLIQDSLSGVYPSHVLSLTVIAVLTANVYQQKYLKEDVITMMLIVFGMAIIVETVTALQYSLLNQTNLLSVWLNYQKVALASAIISSLWTPLVYYPLNYILGDRGIRD
jgi:rod shape-determining protein MreD